MQRFLPGTFLAVLFVMQALATPVEASVVRFTGTWSNYAPILGAADPLTLVGQTFGIMADVDGAGNVTSGHIRITSGPGSHYSIAFTGANTSSALAPFALNNIPTASGGALSFGIGTNIANFLPAGLDGLNGLNGFASLAGNFGGGNIGVYSASITAVPEPGSAAVLMGLVVGGLGLYRRKRAA
jgi:hypothetical protein